MESMTIQLTGVAPLYLHNNQTVDPLNKLSLAIAKITKKRNKTEADHEAISRLEFLAGLYVDEMGRVVIPAKMLAACFVDGAKKAKNGKLAKAGVVFPEHAELIYEGPRDPEQLYKAGFFSRDPVKVQRNTVIRTRPRFVDWSADITLEYDPSIIDAEAILNAWNAAGKFCGIGDWRPQNGRFAAKLLAD